MMTMFMLFLLRGERRLSVKPKSFNKMHPARLERATIGLKVWCSTN